jgi:4-hydroxyphenylpyruvate dioxygenase
MKIDYIHCYVKDARASRDWFANHMGFQPLASVTNRHTHTIAVKNGSVYLVLSSPLTWESPVAQFLRLHPPGVADIAFQVSNLESVMEMAIAKGAKVLQPVRQQQLPRGGWKSGKIAAWGSVSHTLSEYAGTASFLSVLADSGIPFDGVSPSEFSAPTLSLEYSPTNFQKELTSQRLYQEESSLHSTSNPELFTGIDHVVLNVAVGDLERALRWYEEVLGFQRQQTYTIQTDYSGLRSQVMVHPDSGVQFPINEPTSANSQIQEFLDINQGPGIQHIALQTPQIVRAIAQLRALGLSFLPIPATYYTQLQMNYPELPVSPTQLEEIAAQEILVDWQDETSKALLLQTFTQPIFDKPTFFFELIERRLQAQGFGEGNFRALFEAIEREQMKRGSLKSD